MIMPRLLRFPSRVPYRALTEALHGRSDISVSSEPVRAVAYLDTEYLHEYRVAGRRARSILKVARSVLPAEAAFVAGELAWPAPVATYLPRSTAAGAYRDLWDEVREAAR